MRSWTRWLSVIAGLALAFVVVSAVVRAIGQSSWGPVEEVAWIPAVIPACMPGAYRRCLPHRYRQAG
jgi:hypothetical protein